MKVMSSLLNEEIEIESFQGDDGREVLSKNSLLEFYLNELPKKMPEVTREKSFDPIKTDLNHCLCRVTIRDSQGRHIEECGESNTLTLKSDVDKENPFGTAFNRASDKAIRRYLGLPQDVYSSSEFSQAGAAKDSAMADAAETKYDYGDIEISLGGFAERPQTVKDVISKNLAWARWAITVDPDSFQVADANMQLDAIKTYMSMHGIS